MQSQTKLPRGLGKSFFIYTSALATAAALSGALTGAAFAQESTDEEVIVVTGSRIARDPNVGSPAPIQSVTAEQLSYGGTFNTIDVLNDVPALLAATTSETSNQDATPDGQNTLNLRGLGEDRTLVLVNGRRFVSGVEGSQSVDIGAIPQALIERVEVLTGGASAVYGADAVTGVVNFVLKEDFEGLDINVRGGISGEGDADEYAGTVLYGQNFDDDRGNFTVSLGFQNTPGIKFGDRDFTRNNATFDDDSNPNLRFQRGEIGASTPNLAAYYDYDTTGLYNYGLRIPTQAAFIEAYTDQFGSAPTLTAEEQALFERGATSPSRTILPFHNFSISSRNGIIAPADFAMINGVDVDGNGVEDCLDSFVGYNSSLDGAASFGMAGGCWVPTASGLRPTQDGLIAGNFNSFGGDGIENFFNEDTLIPKEQRVTLNFTGRLDVSPGLTLFGEMLYSYHHIDTEGPYNTFYDLLYGAPDNPFLPAELQTVAANAGGLFITRDMTDFGTNIDTNERRTFRTILGAEGEWENGWTWELSANYGEFALRATDRNYVILDRVFAAIDVVDADPGPGVTPVCRSDLNPSAVPPTTIFELPGWDPGIYSFTPGDGQCAPADIWSGNGGVSQAAVDFITTTVVDNQTISQAVFNASMVGDFPNLPFLADRIGFALGAEYREETSRADFNAYDLGYLPEGSPFGAGTPISDVSGNESLGFEGNASRSFNSEGEYDVWDVFGEVSIPILSGLPFAEELTLDGAYRYSEYSTIGDASTWKYGLVWSPIVDLRIRASQSQSVRAPNIGELFAPDQPAFFRPVDPCDVAEIPNAPNPAVRQANCVAALTALGFSTADAENFTDPLSARFAGVVSGNQDLKAETADTTTAGFVLQPRFVPGLTLSADYWNIAIADAIAAVSAQDIVDNCYDSTTFPNDYCALFERNPNAGPQLGGFTFLRQSQVNFGALEAEGVDMSARYEFSLGAHDFGLFVQATHQSNLDRFFDPADPTVVDPELGELFVPEWAGNFGVIWSTGPLRLGYNGQYVGEQLLRNAEIETYETVYGSLAEGDAVVLHDLTGQYELNETITLFAGAENITDEVPYLTEFSWPSGPRGRFFFLGVNARW